MTVDEVIGVLSAWRSFLPKSTTKEELEETLDMAIEALETIEKGVVPVAWHNDVYETIQKRYIDLLGRTRWIPVSERLPEKNQPVLITDGKTVGLTLFYQSPKDFVRVTHWMPLPEPPETTREDAGHWDGIAPEQEVEHDD